MTPCLSCAVHNEWSYAKCHTEAQTEQRHACRHLDKDRGKDKEKERHGDRDHEKERTREADRDGRRDRDHRADRDRDRGRDRERDRDRDRDRCVSSAVLTCVEQRRTPYVPLWMLCLASDLVDNILPPQHTGRTCPSNMLCFTGHLIRTLVRCCRHRERDDRKRHREDDQERGSKKDRKDGDGVSINETNRMRAELGLKPLK